MQYDRRDHPEVAAAFIHGAVGVLKTDTLYGILASVSHRQAVEHVYRVRGRSPMKPCIVLIAGEHQLLCPAPDSAKQLLTNCWPGPVSIILPVDKRVPSWLHRGTHSLAYRVPAEDELRALLELTGPLMAPSANPEGKRPACSVEAAWQYFGNSVDFYVDSGPVPDNTPSSQLLRVGLDGAAEKLR